MGKYVDKVLDRVYCRCVSAHEAALNDILARNGR